MSHPRRWSLSVALLLGVGVMMAAPATPASADHLDDQGTVVGGVGSEAEALAYPCPKTPGGGYAKTGPVVCVSKRASVWRLTWDHNGYACNYGPGGWSGTCIFDNDMGDYIKVWGTRGIPDTDFTVQWGHGTSPSGGEPTPGSGTAPPPGGGSGGSGTGGYSGDPGTYPSGPSGPEPPSSPGSPGYPDSPDYMPMVPAAPGAPMAPGVVGVPDLQAPDIAGPDGVYDASTDDNHETALASGRNDDDDGSPWVAAAIAGILVAAAVGGAVMVSRSRA